MATPNVDRSIFLSKITILELYGMSTIVGVIFRRGFSIWCFNVFLDTKTHGRMFGKKLACSLLVLCRNDE